MAIDLTSYATQRSLVAAYFPGEASQLAILEYSRLNFATLLDFDIFGMLSDGGTILSAAIIIGAVLFVVLRDQRPARRPNALAWRCSRYRNSATAGGAG